MARKGGAFERKVVKALSLWYTRGERDDIFWRTAGSGARATTRAKKGRSTANSAGDIGVLDAIGEPLIKVSAWELKKGYSSKSPAKRASLMSFLDNLPTEKEPLILRWARKVKDECKTHNRKFWFIVFQRDRKQSVICMDCSTFKYLNNRNPKKYIFPPFGAFCDMWINGCKLRFMLFSDFLNWCDPQTITRRIRRRGVKLTHDEWLKDFSKTEAGKAGLESVKERKIRRRK